VVVTNETPLTEDWLRAAGFLWDQRDRQPTKHWLLWVGPAIPTDRGAWMGCDDFGLELAEHDDGAGVWRLWLRADYAGRYTRFIFARDVRTVGQVTRLIEALIDTPFDPANVDGGYLRSPAEAARIRVQDGRWDVLLAKDWGRRVERQEGRDPSKRETL
jgi:hypothetical protein